MSDFVRVLNSVAASGADCTVDANGNIQLPGAPLTIRCSNIKSFSVQAYTADTAGVRTGTPSAANSTQYQIQVGAMNTQTKQWQLFQSPIYTSDASATATEICDFFRTWINALVVCPVTGTGTTTLILTGDTYYPYFTATNIGTGTISFAETTPAVVGKGSGAKIDAVGEYLPAADQTQIVTTNNYTTVQIELMNVDWTGAGMKGPAVNYILYVNEGDTDYPSLVGYNSTQLIGFGTLTSILYNQRKATYSAVGANVDIASSVATRASGSFFTENIKGGDGLLIGTVYATIAVPYTDGATTANLIFDKATVVGSDVSAAAASLIRFTVLPN